MNALEQKIIDYQNEGWILVSHNNNVAQLRKPKKSFSCLPNLLSIPLFIIGLFMAVDDNSLGIVLMVICAIYPALYFFSYIFRLIMKREKYITLIADEQGIVKKK